MHKSDRKRLEEKLACLSESERRKLYKLAGKMRKAAMSKNRVRPDDLTSEIFAEESSQHDNSFVKYRKGKKLSLDEWVLHLLEKEKLELEESTPELPEDIRTGVVISAQAGQCQLLYEHQEYQCLLRPELAMAQRSDLAVGDVVDFSAMDDGTYIVEQVHPRRTVLSRPDPHNSRLERVIAANVDVAVVVASIKSPRLSTNLIDRYLLAVERGGVKPVVCINKIDLLEGDDKEKILPEAMKPYSQMGVETIYCSTVTGEGVDELIGTLRGQLGVFVGHSGVGKTSLLNAIQPGLDLPTGKVRQKSNKGRHVTATSFLYELDNDVRIIDTPGIRSFGLWKMSAEELRWYFQEFDPFAQQCKFSDCTHTHEPNCAVQEAVKEGEILSARYESYLRILESLSETR